jgi:quercetin dioxygenase-like cupin family protein
MIKAYKLYTGNDGHSHVQTGTVNEGVFNQASSIRFQESPPHSFYDWHNAPVEQYVITLSGTLEFETLPGETFIVRPGEILIALDTTGTAHKWKLIDDEPWKRVYIPFDPSHQINFIPDEGQIEI